VRRLAGVRKAEPELAVAVKLVHGWRSRQTAIVGLEQDHSLLGLLDTEKRSIPLPENGLTLSSKLADLLAVSTGDVVEVRVLTGGKPVFHAPVASVVEEYMGVSAYAHLPQLSRWIGEADAVTGARLLVDPRQADALGRELKDLPAVAAVTFKAQTAEVFEATVAESQDIMLGVLLLFAGAIIFGVLYNAARIALAERHRELGALRVLGFTHREAAVLLSSENLLLAVLALVPGLSLGVLFSWLLTKAYETDLYRFPFVLTAESMFWTVVVTLAFAVLASLAVLRRLRKLDLVEVLKARE
jgi:putative ABC transport system permease protein